MVLWGDVAGVQMIAYSCRMKVRMFLMMKSVFVVVWLMVRWVSGMCCCEVWKKFAFTFLCDVR